MKRCTMLAWAIGGLACQAADDGRQSTASMPATLGNADTDSATSADDDATGVVSDGSASASTESQDDDDGDTTAGAKFDLGDDTGGAACVPEDICCLQEGQWPPHAMLDAFLAAYPDANMPKSVAAIQAFAPAADGHMMAWSDLVSGGEIIDPSNGGIIEANIDAGRLESRTAAEAALPADALDVQYREDPIVIEVLGGEGNCNGVGWGWGSILFRNADLSIGEVVYLYIGYCVAGVDGDIEAFYYSDEAVQICAPPG